MAQQPPPDEQAPSWLANPSDNHAVPAPTAYQDWSPASEQEQKLPGSFVPVRPAFAPSAADDGGFEIGIGSYTIRGWHAVLLIGLGLGLWTAINLIWHASMSAAFDAFSNAPVCSGPITNSCRGDLVTNVTFNPVDKSTCVVDLQSDNNTDWAGRFAPDACRGLLLGYYEARVQVWNGQLVYVERRDLLHAHEYFWSTDSAVGQYYSASGDVLLPLLIDAFYVIALVLALIYRFVHPPVRGR